MNPLWTADRDHGSMAFSCNGDGRIGVRGAIGRVELADQVRKYRCPSAVVGVVVGAEVVGDVEGATDGALDGALGRGR